MSETKEIIKEIRENTENALPFNRPTPAFCCAVLLRDFYDELNPDEKEFCREIITEFASLPLHNDDYENHIFDGAEPAIKSLASLIKHFPQNKDDAKLLLFLLLLNRSKKISIFATESVLIDLWHSNYEDAQSIFLGFLQLKPKYDKLAEKIIEEKYNNNIFSSSYVSSKEFIPRFAEECEIELESIIQNKISFQDLGTLQKLNFRTLITAFELLPLGTTDESHKKFVTAISSIFADNERMQIEDKKDGFTLNRTFAF